MAQNFLPCDREQELLPPSLAEWLPEGHLAWFVLDAVEALDLGAVYADYRQDGWGRAAHEPAMMVALLLYAYALGERSSRAIERRFREDVAFRVICANRVRDHTTIARFRARHERALADTFTQVLALCAKAGLVSVGVIAIDGSLLAGNASPAATRSYTAIRQEVEAMLEQAACADAEDDARLGEARGDELPAELASRRSRRERLRRCREELVAAEVTQAHNDSDQLQPMVVQAAATLVAVGIAQPIGTVLADGGDWNSPQISAVRGRGIEVLVPTKNLKRTTPRTLAARQGEEARHIEAILASERGRALYRRRQQIVEPVFAHTKLLRRIDRFQRRGLAACQAEWRLIAATHNLLKLWRAGLAARNGLIAGHQRPRPSSSGAATATPPAACPRPPAATEPPARGVAVCATASQAGLSGPTRPSGESGFG